MDKKKQYEKTMKYYNMLLATIEKNKRERKKVAGHAIFNLSTNPIWDSITLFGLTVGLSFVFGLLTKIPTYLAIPVAAASAITTSMLIPMALHKVFMHSKHKIGRGYAKMELDSYFDALKSYTKENIKNLINSKSADDVTERDLDVFASGFGNVTENYKKTLDKYVGKKIYKQVETDYKKIQKLLSQEKNQEKNRQKIEKIIERNEKLMTPWCELYNTCGQTAKNLYNGAHDLDNDFEILPDNKFVADKELLRKKVNNLIMKSVPTKQVDKTVFLQDVQPSRSVQQIREKVEEKKKSKLQNYFQQKENKNDMNM